MRRFSKFKLATAATVGTLMFVTPQVQGYESLGVGTAALLGNDLTDIGNDGDPEADIGYDAIFDSSDEQGFGGGEFAFNVFDNRLGGGNDKWCCGKSGGIFDDDPAWISAQLPTPHFLTHFTVSSANDTPGRDPNWWAIQGSNDGENYTTIYEYDDVVGPWEQRLEVIQFSAGDDFPTQDTSYSFFRFAAFNTPNNPSGAYFQLGELEFFGSADGVVPPIFVGGENTIGSRDFAGSISNKVFGPETEGLSGWNVKLVDTTVTVDSHTIAEDVLDNDDGDVTVASRPVVDLAGGSGTFPANLSYPNDVDNESMEDFAVRAVANVTIPVGTWTIGFGTDDGGQLTIGGVEFDLATALRNDSVDGEQIRFEGNRGHAWTTGVFEVTGAPLETTIVASMHERGGGDTFEIALAEGDKNQQDASPAAGWELLGNGTFGWQVTHTGTPLVSADLSSDVSASRPWQFDINGTTGQADQFVVPTPDDDVYNTILNMDGVAIQIKGTGNFAPGDAFQIIDADQIVGNVTISSVVAGQNWVFDAETGRACFVTCPAVGGGGDYNGDGVVDAADADAQAAAMKTPGQNLGTFDENNDGTVDYNDRVVWIHTHANGGKGTWVGDADLNGEFNSSDFVTVFVPGKYETGQAAGWAEGDWSGDGVFNSGDFVAAFVDGGYENGPRTAVSAVPEPTSWGLMLLGLFGLAGRRRR